MEELLGPWIGANVIDNHESQDGAAHQHTVSAPDGHSEAQAERARAGNTPPVRQPVLTSAVIWSFSPDAAPNEASFDVEDQTAMELQRLGGRVQVLEVRAMTHGQDPARVRELVGLVASAGEQIGLAGTAVRDAQSWLSAEPEDTRAAIAARALSEMANYYSLGAAHTLTNVLLRESLLDSTCVHKLEEVYKRQMPFPVSSDESLHWASCNKEHAKRLCKVTKTSGLSTIRKAGDALKSMVCNDWWKEVADRRNIGYHRWRSQSVEGGVDPNLRIGRKSGDPLIFYSQSVQPPLHVAAAVNDSIELRRRVAEFAILVSNALPQVLNA